MIGLIEVLLFITLVLALIYIWCKYNYSYWQRKNVPFIEPVPFFGNFKEMFTLTSCPADHLRHLYNYERTKDEPVVGIFIFHKPGLMIRDPDMIKSILVKDFIKFSNRYCAIDPHADTLGASNLFFLKNPQWRELRNKLTSIFTSAKMKEMFPLIEEIGRQLDRYLCDLDVDPKTNSSIQELKDISALFTMDVIATVAFGIQVNSLKNPSGHFPVNGRNILRFTYKRAVEFASMFFLPEFRKILRCKIFLKQSTKFLRDTISFVMAERIKSGVTRNDLIDVLLAFRKAADADPEKKHFATNNDVLVAQAAFFFTAGYETSSSTMAFALYELSKEMIIQKRLREEIREGLIKYQSKVTYEMVNEMELLNMVIQEVLRLYPPLPFLDRECTLPDGETEFSLKPFSDFAVPNGMPVYIPIYGIHRDPKYFPNPDKFNPERFSAANKENVKPFTYMPFGSGPHGCIGERIGLLQTKIGIIHFLRNHYITVCEKSQKEMILDPMAITASAKGGIYCEIVRDPLIKAESDL